MNLNVNNETNKLVSVVLGIANDLDDKPDIDNCIDPKTRESIINDNYPNEIDCIDEIERFTNILLKYDIEVLRPKNIKNLNQIFSRDIAFVIENKLFIPEIIKERNFEKKGIDKIINDIKHKIYIPKNAKIEGGDIILYNDIIFIGYSKTSSFNNYKASRTNEKGLEFIKNSFPNKKIYGFELIKDDYDPYSNILHLDCTMQPIGNNQLILYENGFKNKNDVELINKIFGKNNIIKINNKEFYNLNTNIFSIDNKTIVSNTSFTKLNTILENLGYKVEKTKYDEISKFGGLFRCTTLPLERKA